MKCKIDYSASLAFRLLFHLFNEAFLEAYLRSGVCPRYVIQYKDTKWSDFEAENYGDQSNDN